MTAPTRLAPSSKNFALAADSLNEGKYRLGVSPSLYHLKSRWPPIPNGCSGPSSAPAMNPSTDVDRAVTTIVMLASSPGTVPGHPAPPAVRRASWSWRLGSARGGAMVSIDLLGIYLNDHLGGSIAGVEVAEKLRSKNEGTPFGTTLSGLVLEVKEDRATLENLMDRLGIERSPANADFHATGSAQGSGELVAQGAVAPPGDGGGCRQVGLAQDGCVGTPLQADGDGVASGDDLAWDLEEAALEGVGGGGGVAGQPRAQGGQQGLGQHGEHDVEVDVEVDGAGERVGVKGADDLGQALFDGHAAGVVADQGLEAGLVVVGDDDGGGVVAQAGDDELAEGAGVAGQGHGGFVDFGPAVFAGPVEGHGGEVLAGQGIDLLDQGG